MFKVSCVVNKNYENAQLEKLKELLKTKFSLRKHQFNYQILTFHKHKDSNTRVNQKIQLTYHETLQNET